MTQGYCDLHVHSVYSDGTDTPSEIIEKAEKLGLTAVALTDHNSVNGLEEFTESAKGRKVSVVTGVEFSTDYRETELHVVALFIKREYYSQVDELLKDFAKKKEESNIKLIEGLNKNGYEIRYEDLLKTCKNAKINRANVGAELVKKGYFSSVDQAFKSVLSKEYGLYVQPKRPNSLDVISFINEVGAVPVLAHPFYSFNEKQLREFLPIAKQRGLKAMETEYSAFTTEERKKLLAISNEFNLYKSGGSDYHGNNKPNIQLGTGLGDLRVPSEFYFELKNLVK